MGAKAREALQLGQRVQIQSGTWALKKRCSSPKFKEGRKKEERKIRKQQFERRRVELRKKVRHSVQWRAFV